MSETLETLLTPMWLVRSTDHVTLQRAQPYAEGDAIAWLTVEPQRLEARVQGSRPQPYAVEFAVRNGELGRRCNCPMGNDGDFCKHLAAVALAWLAGRAAAGITGGELPAIRHHLQSLPAAELVELLMRIVADHEPLRAQLLRTAQRLALRDGDLDGWRQALQRAAEAFGGPDFDDRYQDDESYVSDESEELCALVDMLIQRFEAGAEVPVERVEEAIEVLNGCFRHSGEWASSALADALEALAGLHLRVLQRDPPDAAVLAAHLIGLELDYDDNYDDCVSWRQTARDYADLLGPAGLAEHRRIALQRLEAARADGDADTCAVMRAILIDHAQLAGDLDAEIALLAENLTGTTTYLQIAEKLHAAGRGDEALAWAERGLAADAEFRGDWHLRPFLIERYAERGRGQQALALAWAIFDRDPRLDAYQKLHALAGRFGVLDVWQPLALARLDAIPQVWLGDGRVRETRTDRTRRIEALCWEGEYADAWAAAKTGHCAESVLEALADASVGEFPVEAAAAYRQRIEQNVAQTSGYGYGEAIRGLHKLRPLLDADGFAAYVADLRERHRRKRNFLAMLAQF